MLIVDGNRQRLQLLITLFIKRVFGVVQSNLCNRLKLPRPF